ncbi:hypothetical protein J3E72DRAFT_273691 [Bipolaris maydis]|nr:hypothetical protein J3E72DRAFT_273691 [Bipolaris maydis]
MNVESVASIATGVSTVPSDQKSRVSSTRSHRHKKSVHQVDFNNRSYRCWIWQTDVGRSKWNPEQRPSLISQEPIDAHLDANLVLASMDKPLPLSPTTRCSSPLNLSIKRDHERWSSLDLNLSPTKDEH